MREGTSVGKHGGAPSRFFVFTSPRSGSSWLVDLLDSHPRIAAYGELFLPGDRTSTNYGSRDFPRFEATLCEGRNGRLPLLPARMRYLNRLYAARPGVEAIGFKLMYGHPRVHRGLFAYLAARRIRAVHLVRANTLDQLVSNETALARRQFRAREGDEVASVAVRVDTPALVERLARMERAVEVARASLRRRRIATLEVVYERMLVSPEDELDRVLAFLGVEPSGWDAVSTLVQMNQTPRADLVENRADVVSALAGTRFAWMLEDGLRVPV